MFDQFQSFVGGVIARLKTLGIDQSDLEIDHIAYSAGTTAEYDSLRPKILELGELIAEDLVGGRRVGVVRLREPIEYEGRKIPGVELIEPVKDVVTQSGLNHVEMVIPMGYEAFMSAHTEVEWETGSLGRPEYPHLKIKGFPEIKFHEMNIFETVEKQHMATGRKEELVS